MDEKWFEAQFMVTRALRPELQLNILEPSTTWDGCGTCGRRYLHLIHFVHGGTRIYRCLPCFGRYQANWVERWDAARRRNQEVATETNHA